MGNLSDIDLTGEVKKRSGNILGTAHEYLVIGILLRLGLECAPVPYQGGSYDLIIGAYDKDPQKNSDAKKRFITAQVKTADKSISLIGGIRSGVDREYISDVKKYKYSEKDCDLIIGVDREKLDLYILPTRISEKFGGSKSLGRLQPLKNRWDIFINWNNKYIENIKDELPDFKNDFSYRNKSIFDGLFSQD